MKNNLTEIVVIADRSGSMDGIITEARNSINRLISEQKEIEGEANFTFVMFDDNYTKVLDRKNLKDVPYIGDEYYAMGMTALLDAIGKTINHIGEKLRDTSEEERPSKVIVAIITDGHENASKEFNKEQIADMIKTQQDIYNWEFFFFGANFDAFAEGYSLNIPVGNVFQYENTNVGIKNAYFSMSTSMSNSRSVSSNAKEVEDEV